MNILSDSELQTIMLAFIEGRGKEGATEEELAQVYHWAAGVRTDMALLNLVLQRKLLITDIKGSDLEFIERK